MGNAIRKIVNLDHGRTLSIEVPPEMGNSVELIVLSCDENLTRTGKTHEQLTEDEAFLISAYSAVIEEDSEEDKIWERYLHVG